MRLCMLAALLCTAAPISATPAAGAGSGESGGELEEQRLQQELWQWLERGGAQVLRPQEACRRVHGAKGRGPSCNGVNVPSCAQRAGHALLPYRMTPMLPFPHPPFPRQTARCETPRSTLSPASALWACAAASRCETSLRGASSRASRCGWCTCSRKGTSTSPTASWWGP